MNKYRKAFEKIAGYRYWNASKPDKNGYYHHKHFQSKFPEELDLIEDLVEKSEPMNVTGENCPKCGCSFVNYEGCWDSDLLGDFCQFCGQALERGKDDPSPH